MINAVYFDMK